MHSFHWLEDCESNSHFTYRDEIIKSIQHMFHYYTGRHAETLVVRFDLKYPQTYPQVDSNKHISLCIEKVMKKYKRQGFEPVYFWVFEQDTSSHPHYHCFLLFDAAKTMNYAHVFKTVEQYWQSTLGVPISGCVTHCTLPQAVHPQQFYNGILLNTAHTDYPYQCQTVFNQVSYLAKAQTKAPEDDGKRNFGMSRIPNVASNNAV